MLAGLICAVPLAVGAGVTLGSGGSALDAENKAMASWQRIGPELSVDGFVGRTSLGLGAGYQSAYYVGGSRSIRRNDWFARASARYHFGLGDGIEHVLGGGLWYHVSFPSSDTNLYDVNIYYSSWKSAKSTLSFFVSYGPSFRLSERHRLTVEGGLAFSPALSVHSHDGDWPGHLELNARLGWEYRFFD